MDNLGQHECPATAIAMLINGLHKGNSMGAWVSGIWVGEVSYRSLIGRSPLLPLTSASFTPDTVRKPCKPARTVDEVSRLSVA